VKNFLRRFDWTLFAAMVALAAIGVVFVRSAGSARAVAALQTAWKAQSLTALLGLIPFFALAATDYRKILRWGAWPCYALSTVFLVAVLLVGAKVYGGRRWLWFFQPSEVAKIAVIALLAQLLGTRALGGFRSFLLCAALAGGPCLLILLEPDLGTTLVLLPAVLAMLLAARVWTKGLVTMLATGALAAGLLLGTVWYAENRAPGEERARIYARLPLREHQIQRLRVFLFPESDPYDGGWNLRQAKISIGSGALSGKGLGKGEQKFLGYLPPSVSMNDFIFAVLAEEWGFTGSLAVLLLFLLVLGSGLRIAFFHPDDRGRLLAVGVTTLVFAHVYVNVAMSIGLVPITGLPLPFISAGRTFLLVLMIALGLLQSVAVHGEAETI